MSIDDELRAGDRPPNRGGGTREPVGASTDMRAAAPGAERTSPTGPGRCRRRPSWCSSSSPAMWPTAVASRERAATQAGHHRSTWGHGRMPRSESTAPSTGRTGRPLPRRPPRRRARPPRRTRRPRPRHHADAAPSRSGDGVVAPGCRTRDVASPTRSRRSSTSPETWPASLPRSSGSSRPTGPTPARSRSRPTGQSPTQAEPPPGPSSAWPTGPGGWPMRATNPDIT